MRGHGTHDGFHAVDLALVEVFELLTHAGCAGHHGQHLLHRAHLAQLLHLRKEVLEGEVLLIGELLGHALGLGLVPLLLSLLDECEDVTHVQDARGHAVRVELLEVAHALAGGGEHDGLAGDRTNGERGTTAGIAVELGEHHACEVHAVVEGLGGVDRVLADHGVDDEEHFVRVHGVADVAGLAHQGFVDAQTAGGVDDDHVVELGAGVCHAVAGDLHRITGGVVEFGGGAGLGSEHRNTGALTDHLELGHGVGTLKVGGNQDGLVPLIGEPFTELAGQSGLTGTLQTREHDHGGAGLGQIDTAGLATQNVLEFLVDDLDDLLAGVQCLGHLGTQSTFLDGGGEFPDHGNGDVGLEKGAADFPYGGVHIRFGQPTLAAQVLEGRCKPVGQ